MEAFFAVQEESGIPVSTGVAQVIAESGFGLYGPGGDNGQGLSQLAYEYKNLFGIKYFSGDKYAIGGVDMSTGEETGNGNTTIIAGFSVYPDYGACIRQRGWMLNREPYAGKVAPYRNHNDKKYTKEAARGFMNGIRAAGWATDSSYVEKCVQHMDNYNLYRFDNMTYEEYQKSGGGNYDGTVTPLMQSIVDHAANNQGIYPCTPDMCAQWVTGIYQAAGAPTIPYGNAIDMWNNYKNTGNTSMENIPPGAIVCGSGYGTMGSIYGHVGIYLGNGMVANNRGYFSVESLEEWCSWQTATCQGHTGWIGSGVPRWSSGKLEQKERKNQYEQSSFNGETDTGSGSTIFSGRVSHCSGKIYAGSGAKVQTGRRADSRLYSLCSIREIGRICREIFPSGTTNFGFRKDPDWQLYE